MGGGGGSSSLIVGGVGRCPTGDDPLTTGGAYEVQTIACTNTTGNFTVTFRGFTTPPIAASATQGEVERALDLLETLGDVGVKLPDLAGVVANATACSAAYGFQAGGGGFRGIEVTFFTELGDLPLLTATYHDGTALAVNETVRGTKENAECANRGLCDYATGHCRCMPGFGGSAGNSTFGLRRDCGMRSADGFTLNPFYT